VEHDHETDEHSRIRVVKRVFAGLLLTLGFSVAGLFVTATSAAADEDGKYWGCGIEP
jgi:hypothetical protein